MAFSHCLRIGHDPAATDGDDGRTGDDGEHGVEEPGDDRRGDLDLVERGEDPDHEDDPGRDVGQVRP
jgi:hypothetical protein